MKSLLAAALLSGGLFFAPIAGAIHHYPDSAKSYKTQVTVSVIWAESLVQADQLCSYLAGEEPTGAILACYHIPSSTIIAVEPKSFNDSFHLMILGHEFWHALGAEHP